MVVLNDTRKCSTVHKMYRYTCDVEVPLVPSHLLFFSIQRHRVRKIFYVRSESISDVIVNSLAILERTYSLFTLKLNRSGSTSGVSIRQFSLIFCSLSLKFFAKFRGKAMKIISHHFYQSSNEANNKPFTSVGLISNLPCYRTCTWMEGKREGEWCEDFRIPSHIRRDCEENCGLNWSCNEMVLLRQVFVPI